MNILNQVTVEEQIFVLNTQDLHNAVETLNKKWVKEIIFSLKDGPLRNCEIKRKLNLLVDAQLFKKEIRGQVLSGCLTFLKVNDFVEKEEREIKSNIWIYKLTPYGFSTLQMLDCFSAWGVSHLQHLKIIHTIKNNKCKVVSPNLSPAP